MTAMGLTVTAAAPGWSWAASQPSLPQPFSRNHNDAWPEGVGGSEGV